MNENPFKITKQTPYGPHLEREPSHPSKEENPFEVVKETQYGPHLRREPARFSNETESEQADVELSNNELETPSELSERQRKALRSVLLAFGMVLTPMKDSNHSDSFSDDGYESSNV